MVKLEEISSERRSKTPQSAPSDSESISKSICFVGYNSEQEETEWYIFEVSDGSKSKNNANDDYNEIVKSCRLPEGVSLVPRHFHVGDDKFGRGVLKPIPFSKEERLEYVHRGSWVAMGSVIYRFGSLDYYKPHTRVACLDLKSPRQSGWKSFSPMINPRYKTNAFALDGKLYVMGGGVGTQPPWPWGEVYDPCVKKWEPLPPPPLQSPHPPPPRDFVSMVDASEKKIMVKFDSQVAPPHTRSCLYVYDTRTSSWQVVDGVEGLHCGTGAAVADGTVFWLVRSNLDAYNFKRKLWSMCRIDGLEEEDVIHESFNDVQPIVLHLDGDKFCIFWVDETAGLDDTIRSHCVKIRIIFKPDCRLEEEEDGFKMKAFVESCQSYTLDQEMDRFDALICC